MDRYDLVVFGATGFTGRLAAAYLAAHAPKELRIAIAGRSGAKLEALKRDLPREVGVIVADSSDREAVGRMVSAARVILSTAGPFATYSDSVVEACVAGRTDYADITGETAWARTLIDRFHDQAARDGTRIVPFCGFDSVPSDLGAWAVVDWIRRTWGQPTVSVSASFSVRGGGINGGTVASALEVGERKQGRAVRDPVLLNPPEHRDRDDRDGNADRMTVTWDPARRKWLAPFVMAAVNTRVVRRSAALFADAGHSYGEGFRYDEALETSTRLQAWSVGAGTAALFGLVASKPGRALVRRLAPAPGEGPSEEARARGSIRIRLLGRAADGRVAMGTFADQGDAGNTFTVKALCESGLAMVLDRDRLPTRAGVLTPATAFGEVLADRLRAAGVTIEVAPFPS